MEKKNDFNIEENLKIAKALETGTAIFEKF